MKKTVLTYIFAFILSASIHAQVPAVTDNKSIPFDLTLDEILRVNITGGGNIEFVFNSMNQYKNGIFNSSFYNTNVQVASSSNWELHFGAESDLIGTDNPANTINKNFVGFTVTWTGAPICCLGTDKVSSVTGTYDDAPGGVANGLALFTGVAGDILFTNGTGGTNGGDITDNKFTIHWECGTQGAGKTPMNGSSLLGQKADRYVTTVFIEIDAL